MLLGLAPVVAAVLVWTRRHSIWETATAAGLAAAGVVAVFAVTVGRKL